MKSWKEVLAQLSIHYADWTADAKKLMEATRKK